MNSELNNVSLDNYVINNGTEFNENDVKFVSKDKIKDMVNNQFAYDDNSPIPGDNIDDKINNAVSSINKETALDSLITKAAIIKAKKEAESEKTVSKEEKAAAKKQFIDAMMYQQGELYYQQHHYIMDGRTKRATRKRLERDYDKGRFKKYTNLNG